MWSERPSAVGARLVEMDRLLRDIQMELAPGREPAPVLEDDPPPVVLSASSASSAEAPDPGPERPPGAPEAPAAPERPPGAPEAPAAPEPRIQVMSELSARLLSSTRELLAGYEQVLVGPTMPQPARRAVHRRPESPDVTLSAAPFVNLEALHEFEQAVSGLPGVRDVVIRGYEGTDRAIIEVRLDGRNP